MKKKSLVLIIFLAILLTAALLSIRPLKKQVANKHLQEGIALYDSNDFQQAVISFKKSIDLNGTAIGVYINLAKAQRNAGLNEDAFTTAKLAILIDANNPEPYSICGEVKIIEQNYDEAIEFLNQAIELDSLLSSAYYYRGVAKANLGRLTESLEDYKKAQQLDKDNLNYYKSSLVVRSTLEDYSGIIADYNKLLELDPSNTEAFYQRGYFKLNLDDFEGALADFNSVLKLDNTIGKAHYYKGLVLAQTGRLEEAASFFNQAAKFEFKINDSYFNEGLAWMQVNQLEKSKIALSNSIKAKPDGPNAEQALLNMGVIALMQAKTKEAVKTFTQIILGNPKMETALFNRALAYGELKEYGLAINDLDACMGLGYKTSDVYFARGVQYIAINNYPMGCNDMQKALELNHPKAKEMINIYCEN